MKKKMMMIFLFIQAFSAKGALIPSEKTHPFLNDFFFPYQWALWGEGQTITYKTTDIKTRSEKINPSASIGMFDLEGKPLKIKMKKDVVVASIDSGIETDHEDFEGVISLNKKECTKDQKPPVWSLKNPPVDKDSNGYPGDCMGWDFTKESNVIGSVTIDGGNRVYDDRGHGTHVAGSISAASNNNTGISGLSSRIKILPIKIFRHYSKKEFYKMLEEAGKRDERNNPLESKVKKALEYAILRKVDVINMSFGYPLISDSQEIRTLIQKALRHNITVVSAAGNNSHNAFILPCAIPGVLCVGASGPLGELASFSNYGSHIDVLAPGDHILSLFPYDIDLQRFPNSFPIQGYGILSGTSQAAPFISSAVAFLKGVYPGISNDEVKARLYLSARNSSKNFRSKYTLHGLFHLRKAVEAQKQPVIRPNFKIQRLSELSNKKAKIKFQVKNYWQSTPKKVSVTVVSEVSPLKWEFSFMGLQKSESKNIEFEFPVPNDWVHSQFGFSVFIEHGGETEGPFFHEVDIYKNFKDSNSYASKIVVAASPESKAILNKDFDKKLKLRSFYEPSNPSEFPVYYTTESLEEGLRVFVWEFSPSSSGTLESSLKQKSFFIPHLFDDGISYVPFFIRHDFNNDGEKDYLVSGFVRTKDGGALQMSFLNKNFEPLFPGFEPHWRRRLDKNRKSDIAFLNFKDKTMRFFPLQTSVGEFSAPVLLFHAYPPEFDRLKHPDDESFNETRNYILYLEPFVETNSEGKKEVFLRDRTVDSYSFMESLRSRLIQHQESHGELQSSDLGFSAKNFSTKMQFLHIFPQDNAEELKALLAVGQGFVKRYYVVIFKKSFGVYDIQSLDYKDNQLASNVIQKPIRISKNKIMNSEGSVFIKPYKNVHRQARIFVTQSEDASRSYRTFSTIFENEREQLFHFIKTYETEQGFLSFYESKEKITAQLTPFDQDSGDIFLSSRNIIRSTFFPNIMFSERLKPSVIEGAEGLFPAVYVDASDIYAKKIYWWFFDQKNRKLFSPIRYNMKIPDNCISLNPVRYGKSHGSKGVFFCKEKESFSLYFLSFVD